MSTERFNMIMHNYPTEIKLSEKKRALYIHISEGKNMPNVIYNDLNSSDKLNNRYMLDKDGWVLEVKTGEKLIRNNRTANKPNMERINGQSIWDGSVDRFKRNALKKFLTEYFVPNITRQLPERIITLKSLHIEFVFYTHLSLSSQDIDNHMYPYVKSFLDALQVAGTIENDGINNIRGTYARYVAIPPEEERRLEVKIHFCENNQRIT